MAMNDGVGLYNNAHLEPKDEVEFSLPEDPDARLVRLKYHLLSLAKHHWQVSFVLNSWSYSGEGWNNRPVPYEGLNDPYAGVYQHYETWGHGSTANEAIDDWHKNFPKEPAFAFVWRVEPEYALCGAEWRAYSRVAIIPLSWEKYHE